MNKIMRGRDGEEICKNTKSLEIYITQIYTANGVIRIFYALY